MILSASTQTFTVSNTGTGDLIIGSITIDGAQASEFSLNGDNCSGKTLTPSEVCTLAVTFAPTVLGAQSAVLEIPSNDPVSPTVQVVLSGAGDYEATPSLLEGTLGTADHLQRCTVRLRYQERKGSHRRSQTEGRKLVGYIHYRDREQVYRSGDRHTL